MTGYSEQLKLQQQIAKLYASITTALAQSLSLTEVQAPLMVASGSGLQDNLSGIEQPVRVFVKAQQQDYEVVHSLAKWKRSVLALLECPVGTGILTDMKALRPDEEALTARHSVLVEQWDWEQVILPQQRCVAYLQQCVQHIYQVLRKAHQAFAPSPIKLPEQVTFIHAEQLRQAYPQLTPKARERAITQQHQVVFIMGIGTTLGDGSLHDKRAPDYDDWSTVAKDSQGLAGLNGDLLVWHPQLDDALELSSMGIRVDASALQQQLSLRSCEGYAQQAWHQQLLQGALPLSIGGGIGRSRVAMWILQQHHISAVQAPAIELQELCGTQAA
ncbi:aspartate--ammonia ligase [Pseudidiomarina sp. PP-1MA]|uniref:Aspartate--ammonia ligase n=1 Tax=Pseudidiomarina sp. PP-1MA TaxID=3237706 RepID=A0AB39X5A7_9GAMM